MKKEKKNQADIWEARNDMPHEEFMDDHGINFNSLPKNITESIIAFDKVYEKALADGFVNEREEKEIILASHKITQQLKKEFEKQNNKKENNGGSGLLGFLLGITLGVIGGAAVRQQGGKT